MFNNFRAFSQADIAISSNQTNGCFQHFIVRYWVVLVTNDAKYGGIRSYFSSPSALVSISIHFLIDRTFSYG